jgi:hypothetical protein
MSKLEKKFMEFHKENPHVYELFKRYTKAAMATGRQNYSAYAIFERIRWHTDIETNEALGFKLNNNHRPYYARMFAADHPKYAKFFKTKVLASEKPEQLKLGALV